MEGSSLSSQCLVAISGDAGDVNVIREARLFNSQVIKCDLALPSSNRDLSGARKDSVGQGCSAVPDEG